MLGSEGARWIEARSSAPCVLRVAAVRCAAGATLACACLHVLRSATQDHLSYRPKRRIGDDVSGRRTGTRARPGVVRKSHATPREEATRKTLLPRRWRDSNVDRQTPGSAIPRLKTPRC